MPNMLFIRLEGPLQSWGERGRWSWRDTAPQPTKSGVVGLLACALGWQSDDEIRQLSQQIQIGVRVDRPGTIYTDYHTVGGGYKESPQLLTAEGKLKISSGKPHTEQTYRDYLYDASFLVAVQADSVLIGRLTKAVQYPYWVIYLGRKSCPPSRPLYEGVGEYPCLDDALQEWPWYCPESEDEDYINARVILPGVQSEGAVFHRQNIISRSHRIYGPYYTKDILLQNIKIIPGWPPHLSPDTQIKEVP